MTNARINGLRSIELGVHDLQKSAEFYRKVWALEDVAAEGDTIHLRGTGREHHVVTLARAAARRRCSGVHFSAPDRATVDALHAQAKALGAKVGDAPAALEESAGGGYGFRVSTPEGHPIVISSDVAEHGEAIDDRSRPTKLTHVVLNSAEVEKQTAFFLDVLGFKWSDSTFMMDFVRCCSDHHSVAFARGNGPSLNHMAYEMPNIDGLMSGAGPRAQERLRDHVGRRPARPRQQRVLLFRRAERLRHRIHHRGRAGRRQLRRPRREMVDRRRTFSRAAGTWPACRPSSRARRCPASCTRKRTSAASR